MRKPPLSKNSCGTIYPIVGEISGFIPSKGISLKENVIVRQEFKLPYLNSTFSIMPRGCLQQDTEKNDEILYG